MNKQNTNEKTIIKTKCDSVNHTRFPKEDHLPDWARRDSKVTKGDRVEAKQNSEKTRETLGYACFRTVLL